MTCWSLQEIELARRDTPVLAKRIHLNSCGTGAMPIPVLNKVIAHLEFEATEGGYEAENACQDQISQVYQRVANLIGAHPDEIALFDSATSAWQAVFSAIEFVPGDRILTGRTEYGSNMLSFLRARDRFGVDIICVPDGPDGVMDMEALASLIDNRVRLIALTHAPTSSGAIFPAEAVGEIASKHGILYILDACQSVGQLPIDVGKINCDILTAAGRKFLRGPRGTGFAYISANARRYLTPSVVDIQSGVWSGPEKFYVRDDAKRFEHWERSIANILGLGEAIAYAENWQLYKIRSRIDKLAGFARLQLSKISEISLHDHGDQLSGIVSFTVEGIEPELLVSIAFEAGFNISRTRLADARFELQQLGRASVNRLGLHYYNTQDDILAFAGLLLEQLALLRKGTKHVAST